MLLAAADGLLLLVAVPLPLVTVARLLVIVVLPLVTAIHPLVTIAQLLAIVAQPLAIVAQPLAIVAHLLLAIAHPLHATGVDLHHPSDSDSAITPSQTPRLHLLAKHHRLPSQNLPLPPEADHIHPQKVLVPFNGANHPRLPPKAREIQVLQPPLPPPLSQCLPQYLRLPQYLLLLPQLPIPQPLAQTADPKTNKSPPTLCILQNTPHSHLYRPSGGHKFPILLCQT